MCGFVFGLDVGFCAATDRARSCRKQESTRRRAKKDGEQRGSRLSHPTNDFLEPQEEEKHKVLLQS